MSDSPTAEVLFWQACGAELRLTKSGKIYTLDLSQVPQWPAGWWSEMQKLTAVRELLLSGGEISDAEISELIDSSQLRRLHTLDLSHTGVTDAGLEKLALRKEFKLLKLTNSHVTAEKVQQLRPRMVGTRIIF